MSPAQAPALVPPLQLIGTHHHHLMLPVAARRRQAATPARMSAAALCNAPAPQRP